MWYLKCLSRIKSLCFVPKASWYIHKGQHVSGREDSEWVLPWFHELELKTFDRASKLQVFTKSGLVSILARQQGWSWYQELWKYQPCFILLIHKNSDKPLWLIVGYPWQPQNVVTTLQCLTWNGTSLDHAACTLLRKRRKWKYSLEQVQGQDLCKDHASPPLWECFAGHLEFEHNPPVWKTYTWNNLQEITWLDTHTSQQQGHKGIYKP